MTTDTLPINTLLFFASLIASLTVFTIIVCVGVFGLKTLGMISVFGWEKTKELLKDDKFEFGRNINKKLEAALEEEKKEADGGTRMKINYNIFNISNLLILLGIGCIVIGIYYHTLSFLAIPHPQYFTKGWSYWASGTVWVIMGLLFGAFGIISLKSDFQSFWGD